MKRQLKFILAFTGSMVALSASATPDIAPVLDDSIDYSMMDEEEMLRKRSENSTVHKNTATGMNARDYILENRYRNHGDSFSHRFFDHWYLQGGYGVQRIEPVKKYSYDNLMSVNFGIGRQFNRLNSFRLMFDGQYGYRKKLGRSIYKGQVHLDHIFSLSDYFYGYKPDRTVNLSTVIGFGLMGTHLSTEDVTKISPEVHVGPQIKIGVGPRSAMAIEPYVGLGGDQADASENRNWKLYDLFYGVNLNYVYFLSKNYSPEAKGRFMAHRKDENYLSSTDVIPASWRNPWFIEFSSGLAWNTSSSISSDKTVGNEWGLSLGQWLSPAFGIKGTMFNSQTYWKVDDVNSLKPKVGNPSQNMIYTAFRGELLLNPLGFNRNFLWDRPVDFYLFGGMQFGRLRKYGFDPNEEMMRVPSMGYTAGIHLSTRISHDLQAFVEPRYNWLTYKYPNGMNYYKYTERGPILNFGLTMVMRSPKFRQWDDSREYQSEMGQFSFGGFFGPSLFQTTSPMYDGGVPNINVGVYAEYHFNHVNSVKIMYEQLFRKFYTTDYSRLTSFGLGSLGYNINLTNAMSGTILHRFFELESSFGPTIALKPFELSNHQPSWMKYYNKNDLKLAYGAFINFKLKARVNDKFDIFLSPTLYGLYDFKMHGVDFPHIPHIFNDKITVIETINIGLQYNLKLN